MKGDVFYPSLGSSSVPRTFLGLPFTPKGIWKNPLASPDRNVYMPNQFETAAQLSQGFLTLHYPVQKEQGAG